MLQEALFIACTIAIIIGIVVDMKVREVPDWSNYALVAFALSLRAIASIVEGKSILFIEGLTGFALAFVLGYAFYLARFWGGGDSKLLMGIGASLGLSFEMSSLIRYSLFFLALFVLGAVYSFGWMAYEAMRKREAFWKKFKAQVRLYKILHYVLLGLLFVGAVSSIIWSLLFLLLSFPVLLFYLLIFAESVEESCFLITKKAEDLVPGDWLADEVYHHGDLLLKKKTLEPNDIRLLQKNHAKNILIKEGVPFTPSFLLALAVIYLYDIYNKISLL